MAEKHLKKCLKSLLIREMQIKTTLRFHLIPVRMAKIKNSGDIRYWRKCGEFSPFLVGLQAFTITLEISLVVTQKLWHNITCLGIYPKGSPTFNKDTCSTILIAALFIIARSWKEPRCPSTEEWIQKMWYIYTMENYSAIETRTSWNSQANG